MLFLHVFITRGPIEDKYALKVTVLKQEKVVILKYPLGLTSVTNCQSKRSHIALEITYQEAICSSIRANIIQVVEHIIIDLD